MNQKSPIAILAFNRPEYLQQTLSSLSEQASDALLDREVHLFQDGGVNPVSGCEYTSPAIINQNIKVFLDYFPKGTIHVQENNLGIALHFDFVERYLFEKRKFDAAIFLEDDLTLSPLYLEVMDTLINRALMDDRIGCVAAYGNHRASLAEQNENISKLTRMDHRWAFATTRRQWLKQRPYIDEYIALLSTMDYQRRNHYEIVDWFIEKKVVPFVTSQDGVKGAFMSATGAIALMTYCCYGKYIGEKGIHWTKEVYENSGFAATQLCECAPDSFDWPTEEELNSEVARAKQSFANNIHHVNQIFPFYSSWTKPARKE